MGRGVDEAKVGVWRERLARFDVGTMKVEVFCLAEGISKSSFYNWRRKLARSKHRTPTTPQQKKQKKKQQGVFEPVMIAVAAMVVIRLSDGTLIEVPAGSENALRAIVGQLAAANNGADRC